MNRVLLLLALSGTALLPITESLACYGVTTTAESTGQDAARTEASSGDLTTWSVGSLTSISTDVSVLAPDTAIGEHATNTIYAILPAIDRGFETVGLARARNSTVTIQLTNVSAPVSPDGASTTAWTSCGWRNCEILVFREGWASDQYLTYVMAHEFAHVAQQLIYPRVDDNETGWWGEGTAEWFANLVVPGRNFSAYWIAAFDSRSHHTALTDMCYEAAAFFFWAADEYGPDYPFNLASQGEAKLRSGREVAGLLEPGAWHDFIETFLSGKLRYPDGRPARPSPSLGPVKNVSAADEVQIGGPTLSIPRIIVAFQPGEWDIQIEGTTPLTSFSSDRAETWFRIRNDSGTGRGFAQTAECEEETRLVMASVGLVSSGFKVAATIEGERSPCLEPCEAPIPEDHCMIGAWTALSTSLPDTYNRLAAGAEGRPRWSFQDMGDNYAILWPDGTYVMAITGQESEFERDFVDDLTWHQRVLIISDARGRWSVVDDQHLIMCTDEYLGSMFNEITIGTQTEINGPFEVPYDPEFVSGDGSRYRYACAGDTADVTLLLYGAMPFARWDLQRTELPPPPDEPF